MTARGALPLTLLVLAAVHTSCRKGECDPPVLHGAGIQGPGSCAYTFELNDVVFGPSCTSEVPERMLGEVLGTYEDTSYTGGALTARRIVGIDPTMAVALNDTTPAGEGCDGWQFASAFHLPAAETDALARRAQVDRQDHRAEKVP